VNLVAVVSTLVELLVEPGWAGYVSIWRSAWRAGGRKFFSSPFETYSAAVSSWLLAMFAIRLWSTPQPADYYRPKASPFKNEKTSREVSEGGTGEKREKSKKRMRRDANDLRKSGYAG
jgi:hypothetical protein